MNTKTTRKAKAKRALKPRTKSTATPNPRTVSGYLASLSSKNRAALNELERPPFSHRFLILAAAFSLSGCRAASFHDAEIEAVDYAYRAPAVVDPGLVAFRFTNHGKVAHEVQIFRFRPGTTAELANGYLQTGSVPDSAADASGSVLIASAGLTAPERVLVQAVPGELYALMCQFRDSAGKPQHASLGMVALVRVGNEIH